MTLFLPVDKVTLRRKLFTDSEEVYFQYPTKREDMTLFKFHCYRFQDVPTFLNLLEEEGAHFVYAIPKPPPGPMSNGYTVAYWHTEELTMSVFT